MFIKITPEIFKSFPKTQIGFVIADIHVEKIDPYVEKLKGFLYDILTKNGIKKENYMKHPHIAGWREVFRSFGVTHKTNRCSLEALVRRITTGEKMWNVSNVVDLYNCCSLLSLVPMGGYDLDKIKGNICLRFGTKEDKFDGLGIKDQIDIDPKHVVYSDDEKDICWLWNYRDSKHTALTETTKRAIFFLDSAFELQHINMNEAIQVFVDGLSRINGSVRKVGILDAKNSKIEIDLDSIDTQTVEIVSNSLEKMLKEKWSRGNEEDSKKKDVQKTKINLDASLVIQNVPFKPLSLDKLANIQQAIHDAATGDTQTLKKILAFNPSLLSQTDWYNNSLLMHAARGDHFETVKFLIESFDNDWNKKNNNGETALDIAKRCASANLIEYLG